MAVPILEVAALVVLELALEAPLLALTLELIIPPLLVERLEDAEPVD